MDIAIVNSRVQMADQTRSFNAISRDAPYGPKTHESTQGTCVVFLSP